MDPTSTKAQSLDGLVDLQPTCYKHTRSSFFRLNTSAQPEPCAQRGDHSPGTLADAKHLPLPAGGGSDGSSQYGFVPPAPQNFNWLRG
jgi:hypothetical protein